MNTKSEALDFWVVGGGSILFALIFLLIGNTSLSSNPSVNSALSQIGPTFILLAIFVNYPHATWSYRLAYGQDWSIVKKYPFSLFVIPVAIFALMALAYEYSDVPIKDCTLLLGFESLLQKFGIFIHASLYPNLGAFFLAFALIFQMFFLGQHYVMQSFGVTLFCAQRNAYPMSLSQRVIIRYSLVGLWAINLLTGYTAFAAANSMSFTYFQPKFPPFLLPISYVFYFGALGLVIFKVIFPIWKSERKLPPLSAAAAYLSVFFWIQPFFAIPFGYAVWVAPFAHCLQYLYFVGRVESNGFSKNRGSLFYIFLVPAVLVLGYLAFDLVPNHLDQSGHSMPVTASFFVIAASALINIHHYFIDGVVWRSRDSKVRSLLFAR